MKIHIIGGPGSGKTCLAKKLSERYGIPHYDLDELQWDSETKGYGTKRDPRERDERLGRLLGEDDWIIEGVYYAWCGRCFAEADRIYLLQVPRYKYRFRIIRRFLRRKLGIEAGKQETLRSLSSLLRWADHFQRDNLPAIREILEPYRDKVFEGPESYAPIAERVPRTKTGRS